MTQSPSLPDLARLARYYSVISTTAAGSGHPTSALSAADVMTALLFGGYFRADLENPQYQNNDRLIFSKGHAAPLLYALYAIAGKITEDELKTLRQFDSPLEGHPTMRFPYTEVASGSLGQGLSVGVGMALNARLDTLPYRTFVLMGDSEVAEGSVWEAMELASHYELCNLVGIIDVNRLGQRGATMYEHDTQVYVKRARAFGWHAIAFDGHNWDQIIAALDEMQTISDRPVMLIARTLKGKGVSFAEDHDGWHGKAFTGKDADTALADIGAVDTSIRGRFAAPEAIQPTAVAATPADAPQYSLGDSLATRKAYGQALKRLASAYPELVVLDAETSNSTFADQMKEVAPERFLEMFIAEQNMVGTALGLSRRGKKPFCSTFAAFFTRAADQIRMSQYSDANMVLVGSHAGVSIGEDGSSQMALEDISLFRAILGSTVLYPSDAMSAERLVELAAQHHGLTYLRMTRMDTPVIYDAATEFRIGGSQVLRQSDNDVAAVVGAGVTLHAALDAYDKLAAEGILIRVIDAYSIKPIDANTLRQAATDTDRIITVEDHYAEGGLGEAVLSALADQPVTVQCLAVRQMPRSGKPEELLAYEEIDSAAIIRAIKIS